MDDEPLFAALQTTEGLPKNHGYTSGVQLVAGLGSEGQPMPFPNVQ